MPYYDILTFSTYMRRKRSEPLMILYHQEFNVSGLASIELNGPILLLLLISLLLLLLISLISSILSTSSISSTSSASSTATTISTSISSLLLSSPLSLSLSLSSSYIYPNHPPCHLINHHLPAFRVPPSQVKFNNI